MSTNILLGIGHEVEAIPWSTWQSQVRGDANLGFMTEDHHRVRNFVVTEIPKRGVALSPEYIADQLVLPLLQVSSILDDLETHMTFLYRNEQGEVAWAYPVTVDATPHRLTFSSGERINAA